MARKFQKSDIKNAIKGSGGYISDIAKKLKCDWWTAKRYIEKFNLQPDLELEDEESTDIAEKMLMEKVRSGDITAIIFRLKTKGKKRGYIEKQEHEVRGEIGTVSHMQIEFIPGPIAIAQDDFLSIEDLEHIKRLEAKK